MAKKPADRYTTMRDLILDLEAVARGEPPLQARKEYDASLLQGLEERGEAVEIDSSGGANTIGGKMPWVWIFLLASLLGVSLLVNIILLSHR